MNNVNWEIFYKELEENKYLFNSFEFTNLDTISKYNKFVEFIDKSIIKSYKKDKGKGDHTNDIKLKDDSFYKKQNYIWWNDECNKAVRLRKAAQYSIKHKFTIERYIEVKRTEALVRKTLRKEKKKSYRAFCESVNPRTKISEFWKRIKIYKSGINRNQQSTGNKKQEINIRDTIDSLCTPKININRPLRHIDSMGDNGNQCSLLDSPFSFEELDFC